MAIVSIVIVLIITAVVVSLAGEQAGGIDVVKDAAQQLGVAAIQSGDGFVDGRGCGCVLTDDQQAGIGVLCHAFRIRYAGHGRQIQYDEIKFLPGPLEQRLHVFAGDQVAGVAGTIFFQNQIQMQPYLILFKQEWLDAVILHEMVHYKYKHHRKSFWNLLSTLLGEESKLQKVKQDIAMSPFFEFVWFLTK